MGNFLTDKPSSRVLAPPGGGSQIVFGGDVPTQAPARPQAQSYAPPQHPMPQAVNQNQHYAQYTSPPPAQQQYQQQYVSPNAAQQFQPQAIQQPNYGSPQAQNQHYAQYQGGSPQGGPPRGEAIGSGNQHGNNYSRPGGQNVGNFLTDKPSSRVLAPPGGKSQISFY